MEIKEFFKKAKQICDENGDDFCAECPLCGYCSDGIFGNDESEVDKLIELVEEAN
jgi:hypothetical protein